MQRYIIIIYVNDNKCYLNTLNIIKNSMFIF